MRVDINELKKAGYSQKKLRAIFEAKKMAPKTAALINLHKSRIDDGIKRCLGNARTTKALDDAADSPRNQISYTLLKGILDATRGKTDVDSLVKVNDQVRSLGYPDLFLLDRTSGNTPTGGTQRNADMKPGYKINLPVFVTVLPNIVGTFVSTRLASLFAEIDLDPFLKYEPHVSGPTERALGKVVTRRVEQIVADVGLRQTVRQSILQSLMYGVCINFPMESYWKQKQRHDGKEVVVAEGVRYDTPHAARIFWDQNFPQHTLNTETGCEYAGYWNMVRWSEIRDNPDYWNKDKVHFGGDSWRTSKLYDTFSSFYPCVVSFPKQMNFTIGTGTNNRESNAFEYAKAPDDAGVDRTVIFHRLIPKDWGLYDYQYPVWHRFVYAGDETVIHAEPWAYHPIVADLYNSNAQSDLPISLALEALPHQDHYGNLLTQMMLTVKKNLLRVVGVNKDAVPQDFLEQIENNSENALRGIEFFLFSGNELVSQQIGPQKDLFVPIPFQQIAISEQIAMLSQYISFVERVLGFSPHELGVSASHQISAAEAKINTAGTLSRRSLTKSFVADAQFARKKCLYDAFMAYGDDQVLVEVSNLEKGQVELLTKAGLDVAKVDGREGAAVVKGSKNLLKLGSFISTRADDRRSNDPQNAQVMLTMLDRVAANPVLAQSVGLDKIIQIYNTAVDLLGLPEDSRLSVEKGPLAQQEEAVMQAVQQLVAQQIEQLGQKVLQPMAEQSQQTQQAIAQLAQQNQQITQAVGQIGQQTQQTQEALGQVAQATQANTQAIQQNEQLIVQTAEKLVVVAQNIQGAPPTAPLA